MRARVAEHTLEVDILGSSELWRGHEEKLSTALAAAAAAEGVSGAVSLLLGDDVAVAALNKQFRGKEGPTNVLSFPPAQASGSTGRRRGPAGSGCARGGFSGGWMVCQADVGG
jgi:ssRNA-specific RNase YbeY (16S rRNA maturation enzyme)